MNEKDNNIRINLSGNRIPTVLTLLGCAFEMLFWGKTTILVKKI